MRPGPIRRELDRDSHVLRRSVEKSIAKRGCRSRHRTRLDARIGVEWIA